jgi:hypothetical protein
MGLLNSGDAQRCSYPRSKRNYDGLAPDAVCHIWQGHSKRFVQ